MTSNVADVEGSVVLVHIYREVVQELHEMAKYARRTGLAAGGEPKNGGITTEPTRHQKTTREEYSLPMGTRQPTTR
jgi:hypothetical protein